MGPTPARDAVLTAYARKLIRFKARRLARKPGFTRSDQEDLEQELTAYLLARAHLFDPNRASANPFADRVVRSAIAIVLRDRRRKKRAAGLVTTSLERTSMRSDQEVGALRDQLTEADLRRRIGTAASGPDQAELIAAVVEAVRSLPAADREICRWLIEGTKASVARDLGISRRQVRNAIERIRLHFEAAGLGDI